MLAGSSPYPRLFMHYFAPRHTWSLLVLLLAHLASGPPALAQPAPDSPPNTPAEVDAHQALAFWTDLMVQHGWRIQRNVVTENFRLLDERDQVRMQGDFQACRECFERLSQEAGLLPVKGKVVILLHGLFRNHRAGKPLQAELEKHGYTAIRVGYASTQAGIDDHAEALSKIISFLPEATEINFVGHSMGNIVVRKYLSDALRENAGMLDPRIKRFVMLGPPNQGSQVAVSASESAFLNTVAGEGFAQLGRDWEEFTQALRPPPIEFGIIAGNTAEASQGNPLIPGVDDLVVGVEETKLAGARDFLVLPVIHMRMFADRTVQERTVSFLDHGYFRSAEQRHPLREAAAADSTEGQGTGEE
jgi:pimeloyl-ACP methyl ester carboxylesterase